MLNEDIEPSLKKVADWAANLICNRDSMENPKQAIWALYSHMQLLKATESILESIAYAKQSKMVDLQESQPHQETFRQLKVDNTFQDNVLPHQDK